MAKAQHEYKGGRVRPESAAKTGKTPRGICEVCGQAKSKHFASKE